MARSLRENECTVWDGTDQIERRDFPRGIKTHRVVQYDSCRGLEGWVVVAEGLDDFWEYKKGLYEPDPSDPDLFKSDDELASEWAWRWCMILMTRPIDTLVITLTDTESTPAQVLREISKDLPDIVEWHG